MWIKSDRTKIRIYVSNDGCNLKRLVMSVPDDTVYTDVSEFDYCGTIDKLLNIDFVKGTQRYITTNSFVGSIGHSYVEVNPDFEGNITPPAWVPSYVGTPGLLDTSGAGNFYTGPNEILPGDYVYPFTAPINDYESCSITVDNINGLCGQVNIALCKVDVSFGANPASLLQTQFPWLGFYPGEIDPASAMDTGTTMTNNGLFPNNYYSQAPQTT